MINLNSLPSGRTFIRARRLVSEAPPIEQLLQQAQASQRPEILLPRFIQELHQLKLDLCRGYSGELFQKFEAIYAQILPIKNTVSCSQELEEKFKQCCHLRRMIRISEKFFGKIVNDTETLNEVRHFLVASFGNVNYEFYGFYSSKIQELTKKASSSPECAKRLQEACELCFKKFFHELSEEEKKTLVCKRWEASPENFAKLNLLGSLRTAHEILNPVPMQEVTYQVLNLAPVPTFAVPNPINRGAIRSLF